MDIAETNSKNNFVKLAEKLGVPIPKTLCFDRVDEITKEAIEEFGFPCYLKAAISVSGVGIHRCESLAELLWAADTFDPATPVQVQEEVKTDCFLNMQYEVTNGHYSRLLTTEQILDGPAHQENHYPARAAPWDMVEPMAEWLAERDFNEIFAFDVAVIDEQADKRFLAIECNPRFNGASYPTAITLEAVETCGSLLEDDPVFNAGCGSVLNENGKVEMDAAMMDGRDLSAGAVAAVSNIANPIQLARLVMAESEHVMLISEGAMRFAQHCDMKCTPDHYFFTKDRVAQLEKARLQHRIMLDHDDDEADMEDQKYGTIGAVARDLKGNLAAATSTGGIVNKRMGRIGDSPIVGAGVYADNETCAVSATGFGEDFMRTVLAKTISDAMEMRGGDAHQAVEYGIDYLRRKVNGRGCVIVIDRFGNCAGDFTTKKMIHGWIEQGGETNARF